MAGRPVDGCLAHASVANMKVGGTLENEGSIVVQAAPAVDKKMLAPLSAFWHRTDGHTCACCHVCNKIGHN
jgi:hypothetical protein